MKRQISILLLLISLLLTGCAAPKTTPAVSPPAAAGTAAPTAALKPESTSAPTPAPTQMPAPEPIPAEGFAAATAEEAALQIQAALSAYPCYTTDYEKTTYAGYVRYDAAHECVCLRMADGLGDTLLPALSPLAASGALPRLMLELSAEEGVSAALPGVTELILSQYGNAYCGFLSSWESVKRLTIVCLDDYAPPPEAYPPALKSLAVESSESGSLSLSWLCGEDGTLLTQLDTLTVGAPGSEGSLTLEAEEDAFAALPALTALELWAPFGEDTAALYRQALSLPGLKTLNGRAKGDYGPYAGLGIYPAYERLREACWALQDEGTQIPALNGLPGAITGPVYISIASESSWNMEGDASIDYDSSDGNAGFYGIPEPLLWKDGMSEEAAWLAFIFEYDMIAGWYGEREYEEWGYAVETRLLLVELATGRVWQTTVSRTSPPPTNADDTYGDYCPLRAVEKLRTLIKTDLGPFAGSTMNDAAGDIQWHLQNGAAAYMQQGLPASITGKLYVSVYNMDGNYSEEQYLDSSDCWTEEDCATYGIPAGHLLGESDDESAGWLAVICERDAATRQYGDDAYYDEGYTVETHLVIVEMATGRVWHQLVQSSPPPAAPEDTNYGEFFPRKALNLLKPLLRPIEAEA